MFSNSHNFIVNNCHFMENSPSDSNIGIDILLKASTPEAAYDSSARDSAPRCFPGTREQYIEDIVHWALPGLNSDTLSSLFWLKGPAGVGKSALAQSCVENIKDLQRPCAGFFFSINGRNKSERLFPSIAYQLSTIFPAYHDLLGRKISRDKTLVDKTMRSQFRSLFIEPIQELEKSGMGIGARVPIFIDGLDECEDSSAQCEIVEIIASSTRISTTPFCWVFFSRPEPHLENTFSGSDIAPFCHMTILPISRDIDGEIELYLRAGLQNILRHRITSPELSWPPDSDVRVLTQGAGGLFIYAATILRVISQPSCLSPEERLSEILAIIQSPNTNTIHRTTQVLPFADLDKFYMRIMQRIPADILPSIQLFCAYMCLHTGLFPHLGISAFVLSNILRVSGPEFKSICSQLSAVIHFRERSQPLVLDDQIQAFHSSSEDVSLKRFVVGSEFGGSVLFYHKSFYDFLVDPARSGVFCATSLAMRNILFNHLIDLRLDYENSYCIRDSGLVLAPGVPDSASSLSNPYTNELINSIIKINVYIRASGTANMMNDRPDLSPKLQKRLYESDYAKMLAISASWLKGTMLSRTYYRGCWGWWKMIHTTSIFWCCGGNFDNFDAAMFKQALKQQRKAGVLKPYFPDFVSRFKHLLRRRSDQNRIKSGLYLKGHDSGSSFWYWEINYESRYYREFEAADLEEGEKIFQAMPWGEVLVGSTVIDWEEVERKAGFGS